MLDVSEKFLNNTNLIFIELWPKTLRRLLRKEYYDRCHIIENKIQNVLLKVFKDLSNNDILFMDTSHVLKIGSDLSKILFTILPILKPRVLVHIHDIYWSFEYPEALINEG